MFKEFIADESGATAIEYALLAALIGVGLIGGATVLRSELDNTYSGLGTALGTAAEGFDE